MVKTNRLAVSMWDIRVQLHILFCQRIDHIGILGIDLKLACTQALSTGIFPHANFLNNIPVLELALRVRYSSSILKI